MYNVIDSWLQALLIGKTKSCHLLSKLNIGGGGGIVGHFIGISKVLKNHIIKRK